jgi:small subunit ribosomal protein S17
MSEINKKIVTGKVISDKNANFRVIEEKVRVIGHPLYRKFVNKTRKYHAFDEENKSKLGNIVKIIESKPYSKTTCWKIIEIVNSEI